MMERNKATKDRWEIKEEPEHLVKVPIQREYTAEEYNMLLLGRIPQEMEDRWFIYSESGWIYFHRSWTGKFYGKVRLAKSAQGYIIVEAWTIAIENPHRWAMDSTKLFERLLAGLLRKRERDSDFPVTFG